MSWNNNKYIVKFRDDMKQIVKQWEDWETSYYYDKIQPACDLDPVIGKFLLPGGKIMFPTNVYSVWTHNKAIDGGNIITYDDLITAYEKKHLYTISINKMSPLQKGQKFEDALGNALKNKQIDTILPKLQAIFDEGLLWVGKNHKREDFLMSEDYSIDIKYSDLKDYDRFRNIIKPYKGQIITCTTDIIDGILRSLYREGGSNGNLRPSTGYGKGHHGLYKLPSAKYKTFQELTQSDYDKYADTWGYEDTLPSLRKNLIFLFNDGGYWASEMLQKITVWAAARLANYPSWGGTGKQFDNTKGAQSINPYKFWRFSESDWISRFNWYN